MTKKLQKTPKKPYHFGKFITGENGNDSKI
jgi:hypothetical protein